MELIMKKWFVLNVFRLLVLMIGVPSVLRLTDCSHATLQMRFCSARREDVHEHEVTISEPLRADKDDVKIEEHEDDKVDGEEAHEEDSQIGSYRDDAGKEQVSEDKFDDVEVLNAPMNHGSEQEIEQERSQDEQEGDKSDMLLDLPLWIRNNFLAIPHRDMLYQKQLQASQDHHHVCEECSHRAAAFSCTECAISLCMSCTDAIHIVRLSHNGVCIFLFLTDELLLLDPILCITRHSTV